MNIGTDLPSTISARDETPIANKCHTSAGVSAPQRDVFRKLSNRFTAALSQWESPSAGLPPLLPRSPCNLVPLTFQQEFLWNALQKYKFPSCLLTRSVRITGELNLPALRNSLSHIVLRHEALRTRIVVTDGVPQQKIDEPTALHFN